MCNGYKSTIFMQRNISIEILKYIINKHLNLEIHTFMLIIQMLVPMLANIGPPQVQDVLSHGKIEIY